METISFLTTHVTFKINHHHHISPIQFARDPSATVHSRPPQHKVSHTYIGNKNNFYKLKIEIEMFQLVLSDCFKV